MKTYVENAKVQRIITARNGNTGLAVVEEREVRGETYRERATLWFRGEPNERVEVGDRVNASGFLSARAREYEENGERKLAVDVNLNGARIQSVQLAEADPWAGDGGWA